MMILLNFLLASAIEIPFNFAYQYPEPNEDTADIANARWYQFFVNEDGVLKTGNPTSDCYIRLIPKSTTNDYVMTPQAHDDWHSVCWYNAVFWQDPLSGPGMITTSVTYGFSQLVAVSPCLNTTPNETYYSSNGISYQLPTVIDYFSSLELPVSRYLESVHSIGAFAEMSYNGASGPYNLQFNSQIVTPYQIVTAVRMARVDISVWKAFGCTKTDTSGSTWTEPKSPNVIFYVDVRTGPTDIQAVHGCPLKYDTNVKKLEFDETIHHNTYTLALNPDEPAFASGTYKISPCVQTQIAK